MVAGLDGRGLWRKVWSARSLSTSFVGITRVAYMLWWVIPSGALSFDISVDDRNKTIVLVLVYAAIASPTAYLLGRRRFAPVAAWVDAGGRKPSEEERELLLAQPRIQAAGTANYWMLGGVLGFVGYLTVFEPNITRAFALFAGASALGLHAGAFAYLAVERVLRPAVAAASKGDMDVRLEILSVRARFLLAWLMGPGISMIGIVIFLSIRTTHADADIGRAMWPILVLAFTEGAVFIIWAARSVTEPINEVRTAMKRLLAGDLDVEVPVDAASEVGLLQLGFNRMVAGLREREQLRDLLGQHVGTDVARQALERGADFHGREYHATILIVDMIGSTPFAEARPPDEVLTTLNALFEAVVRHVAAEDGWVNKFTGDAAVCVFGAPVSRPDHAARALRAAAALHDEVDELARDHPWLDAGIGVSTGSIVAADVGTSARHEFTVVGDAANEASRLSDLAKTVSGRVLASSRTVEEAGSPGWVAAGEVKLRGKRRATAVCERALFAS